MSEQEASESIQTDGAQLAAILPEAGNDDNAGETRPSAPASNKSAGYDPIDFATATPEQIQQRHDYLYKQIKDQKRTEGALREYKKIAQEQSRRIDELTNGFTGVVSHLQEKSFTENEAQLEDTLQKAWDAGDHKAYVKAQTQLVLLQSKKDGAAKEDKRAPARTEQKPIEYQDSGSGLEPEDQRVVDSWQEEKDESGTLLRPWAYNRSNDPQRPDRQFARGLFEMKDVLEDDKFPTMADKVAEVDRRMGVQKQGSKQTVMGGGLTGNRKTSKLTLSDKQRDIAVKTKFGGPKAKSDADHIEAYRKQIEISKSKGVRQ